jgi:two-component system C4-dicarboxylate transport sensor histidine kinase DctB
LNVPFRAPAAQLPEAPGAAPARPRKVRRPLPVRRTLLLATVGLAAVMVLSAIAWRVAEAGAVAELAHEAQITASLHAAVLRTELDKYRSLPYVLGHDGEVLEALVRRDPASVRTLDRKLEIVSRETKIDVLYVIDTKAMGVAGSNWRARKPFCSALPSVAARRLGNPVGCRDRLYYTEAMRTGTAEMFALGRADRQPGLYFSHAVDHGNRRLGVVVAKVQFDALEDHWRAVGDPTFVTDRDGVVLITSIPEWRLRTLTPLRAEARARLLATHQFGDAPLKALPAAGLAHPTGAVALIKASLPRRPQGETFVETTTRLGDEGWTLHTMKPADARLDTAGRAAAGITFLSGLLALALTALLVQRRERRLTEAMRAAAAREELEVRVAARTSELSAANRRLTSEIDERRRVEGHLHRLQDELVQANKLATLGQIAAGVAHEINQPLAAIRTYAENAAEFLRRKQPARAGANMGVIGDLTARISVITEELRAFSRRATGEVTAVVVPEAVDGALLLVSHRVNQQGVRLVRQGERPELRVLAERVRLEQVLVNLLQNSLDALRGREAPEIRLTVDEGPDTVTITVRDNGPGLAKEMVGSLFMPFVTTKAHGLGLGLVISRDIIIELGGELTGSSTAKGASFTLTLRKPPEPPSPRR